MTRQIVDALLNAGADPLATAGHKRCSALRCAWSAKLLPNGALKRMLVHLEGQRAAGNLIISSGDAAIDVMVAAAYMRCRSLFSDAHERVLAACQQPNSELGTAAAEAAVNNNSSERSILEAAGSTAVAVPSTAVGAAVAYWRPKKQQLLEVLHGAAAGGLSCVLRCILSSPLLRGEYTVAMADKSGSGLLVYCVLHGPRRNIGALTLLRDAGARLDLRRLLTLLEHGIAPAALIAVLRNERPSVSPVSIILPIENRGSYACPIHRLLHIWKVRSGWAFGVQVGILSL